MATPTKEEVKAKDKSLIAALGIIVVVIILLAIVGLIFIRPVPDIYQGQVDATAVRISGKLPGRVAELYVKEGQMVKKGDTLVRIHSSIVDAKLYQAEAMETVASTQNIKVDNGTRLQIKQATHDIWQQAIAAETIAKKTYDRLESLYAQGVVSEQKRDEAQAAYNAAKAAVGAAKSNYDMAVEGAQWEDKASAAAMVNVAKGGVDEVKEYSL